MTIVMKAMKNPRSAVCKTSIMAASDIFNSFGDKLLDESTSDAFGNLVHIQPFRLYNFISVYFKISMWFQIWLIGWVEQLLQLLLKASQDKKFVCEEANKALSTMVGFFTPLPLLHKLKACVSHSNLRIRAKAAISISNCVSKMVRFLRHKYMIGPRGLLLFWTYI